MRNLLIILFFTYASLISASTYYVAPPSATPAGSDSNNGSLAQPWGTWQKAFLTAIAGDTVYFRGGVWYPSTAYNGNNVTVIRPDANLGHNGSPGNPICYFNFPGETPILDCRLIRTSGAFSTALQIEDAHWICWKGLTIRNLYQRVQDVEVGAIRGEALSNMTWENIKLYNIGGHGWYMESDVGIEYISYNIGWDGSGYIPYDTTRYINCDTYQCVDTLRVNPVNHAGNMGDGFKHINGGAYIYYEGCRAWRCSDDGFDMPGFGVTVLKNCWSFTNGTPGYGFEGNGFKFGANDRFTTIPRRLLYNCLSAFNTSTVGGCGFFDLEYDGYVRNYSRINNCVSYKNKTGFAGSNNTAYPNSASLYRNNIAYQILGFDADNRPLNVDVNCAYFESHNNWDYSIPGSLPRWVYTDTVTVSDADFISVDSTGISGPRKSDGSLPDINFLRLAPGSDLIDAGTNVGTQYIGSAPDIGYFESAVTDPNFKPVTSITVSGAGGISAITTDNGTLQLIASVLPADATNKTVAWSIASGTDKATISATGLVTALSNGTAIARATAKDGSGVFGSLTITISNQIIPVTSISVTGAGGATAIATDNGTLQLSAAVLPANATNSTVTWSISSGSGNASVSSTGLVTALNNGTATAMATANDGSGISGTIIITISNQVIPVSGITVTGAGGAITITADDGTLQLSASVMPANATNKTVTWSITSGTDKASVSAAGLVTALDNGTAIARATANDGSGVYGTLTITISNQIIRVTGITITGAGGATVITTDNGTLQLSVSVLPANATNKTVTWSLSGGAGIASVSSTGLVTALNNGTATAVATANDGSGISGTLILTISNQVIPVSSITVTGTGGASAITTDNGILQLIAAVLPANATNKTLTWSITSGADKASINSTGLVTALDNGTATAMATATDGSGVYGTLIITISNQIVPVAGITVTGEGGKTLITIIGGTLQLNAAVLPANASNKTISWSIQSGTDKATINSAGLVTALDNGTARARATANDGSGVFGELTITISNQVISVTSVTVTGAGGATTIAADNATLQLSAAILPSNATDKSVTWSISNGTGEASIDASGLVRAISNGTVTAIAAANDGSGISGSIVLTLSNQVVPVTAVIVTGAGGATTITSDNGTLQLSALITPANATNQSVTWSVANGTGAASITSSGLVTAISNGTATATATANDGSGISGSLVLTLANQVIPVTGITVTGAGGATTITTNNGTLQLTAAILPANATTKTVTWTISNGTGEASISGSGLVRAISNGTVTATATANDGSGITGSLNLTLSNQAVSVTGITVTGAGGATTIATDNGTLLLSSAISPSDATNKSVTWSIANGTGAASISTSGLVTAISNGTVTATASANDGSGVSGSLELSIANQIIPVTGITVAGEGGATTITTDNGTLQLTAAILPVNATNQTVTWGITNGTGEASISGSGLVTAVSPGTVTATATANDGSGVSGSLVLTISNQIVPVTGIIVTGAGGATTITTDMGTLQLSAAVTPANATNKTIAWDIIDGTGMASISATGLVTASLEGTVTAIASATDGSGVFGTLDIFINYIKPLVIIVNQDVMRVLVDESYISGKLEIFNLQGNIIKSMLIETDVCVFNISSLPSGLYIVVLSKSGIQEVGKVIISH
jgi:uncharacterized protein YjdB